MSLNLLLSWFVIASCLVSIVIQYNAPGRKQRDWLAVHFIVAAFTGLAIVFAPALSGMIGIILWLGLVAIPVQIVRSAYLCINKQDFASAGRLAFRLQWLHPSRYWRRQGELWQAIGWIQNGHVREGMDVLQELTRGRDMAATLAHTFILRLQNRWQELQHNLELQFPPKLLFQIPELWPLYMRALGENGNVLQMLDVYREGLAGAGAFPSVRAHGQLMVAAFCGRPDALHRLYREGLRDYSDETRKLWLATAYQSAGAHAAANQLLARLQQQGDPLMMPSVHARLNSPVISLENSGGSAFSRLVASFLSPERKPRRAFEMDTQRAGNLIHGLTAVNALIFVLSVAVSGVYPDPFNQPANLMQSMLTSLHISSGALDVLGAMTYKGVIENGEWWRLLASTFLHGFGLHIAMNMFALYLFGPKVVKALGHTRFLFVYLVAGIGAATAVMLVNYGFAELGITRILMWEVGRDYPLVGASGCVMGLVGSNAVLLFREWIATHDPQVRQRFRLILFIICLQTIFDMMMPQVSFMAHFAGMLLGVILTFILTVFNRQPAEQRVMS